MLRVALLCVPAAALVVAALPERNVETAPIRSAYVAALRSYEGARDVWGGERGWGIDCSGLVRMALVDANLKEGLASLNPALWRRAAWTWWHDTSARALGAGHLGQTHPLFEAESINLLDHTRLKPGDLAVTSSGIHVLAFLGGTTWIQADPNPGRVIVVEAPAPHDPWFNQPVKLVRWAQLCDR